MSGDVGGVVKEIPNETTATMVIVPNRTARLWFLISEPGFLAKSRLNLGARPR